MRGKQALNARYAGTVGITPADAGKTLQYALQHRAVQDHPRGCGENQSATFLCASVRGSPPRMRGKPFEAASRVTAKGITPADAGKTFIKWGLRHTIRDHPRGCGENSAKARVTRY